MSDRSFQDGSPRSLARGIAGGRQSRRHDGQIRATSRREVSRALPPLAAGHPLAVFTQTPHADALSLLLRTCKVASLEATHGGGGLSAIPPDAAAVLAFMSDRVDARLLSRCPRLQIVAGAFKGADNVDVDACTARGVWVTVAEMQLSAPTAEMAVALLLALARRLREGDALVRTGGFEEWSRRLEGFSVRDAAVGVVGAGSLGREVLVALRALGARCGYSDPHVPQVGDLRARALDDLLAHSEAVIVALPLAPGTRNLIDSRRIAVMPRGAVLVNVGRGSTVDEIAVVEALEAGHLAAYAADVFAVEDRSLADRPTCIHPGLLGHPRSMFTPHLGTAIDGARREIELAAARSIVQAVKGERPEGAINELSGRH